MQYLIIIPGLTDGISKLTSITKGWEEKHGISPHIIKFGWQGVDKDLNSRLKIIGENIDDILKEEKDVSLLGTSAGGSAVINLFYPRRKKINKVINVCGRVSKVENIKPVFKNDMTLFKNSVIKCEKIIKKLSVEDKEKILTIRPVYDEVVSTKDMIITGTTNKRIISAEHILSIKLAMTLYSKIIVDFLKT